MISATNAIYQHVPPDQVEQLNQFRAEHPTKQVIFDGVDWEYIRCGEGTETLLLLNGGLRIAETAFKYIQLFEHTYRLIVPTYPPLWSLAEITDGIAAILDREGGQQPFVLGQSYGGMVGQAFVQRHPAWVNKLVLSSTGPLLATRSQVSTLKFSLAVFPRLPERLLLSVWKRSLLAILSPPESERRFWQAYLKDISRNCWTKGDVLSHFRTGEDALKNYAFDKETIEPWQGEVLIIGGENDPVSNADDRQKVAAFYPHAQVLVINGVGHTVGMQAPEKYLAAVTAFFEDKVPSVDA